MKGGDMTFEALTKQSAAKPSVTDPEVQDNTDALEIDGITLGFINEGATGSLFKATDRARCAAIAGCPLDSTMSKTKIIDDAHRGTVLFQKLENKSFDNHQHFGIVKLDAEGILSQVESHSNIAEQWSEMGLDYDQSVCNVLKPKNLERLTMAKEKSYFKPGSTINSKRITTCLDIDNIRRSTKNEQCIALGGLDSTHKNKKAKKDEKPRIATGKKKRNTRPFLLLEEQSCLFNSNGCTMMRRRLFR